MAKTKKSSSKKTTSTKRSFTAKQKEAQKKIGEVNFQARKIIYEAGKKGALMPSWKAASKQAVKKVYGK
ncbi:hypothetical protein QNI19_16405 [Cytophagaceae bacterium DM2B3-1]|uniref:Uncharacterized protein n=2 Tax=Xanthocytophaga TaxID=3078918 RepID=A0ABT7CLA4_9BACT|nr:MULTISPECIES: hypothetical protein [Xanthocytophaga]MDJ1494528.1 hypothetical protein [Xanthocytophaga flavus]MDJ1504991.1 hypothetical protein [Xanthocytophaga agilis]